MISINSSLREDNVELYKEKLILAVRLLGMIQSLKDVKGGEKLAEDLTLLFHQTRNQLISLIDIELPDLKTISEHLEKSETKDD